MRVVRRNTENKQRNAGTRADLITVALGVLLVAAAVGIGAYLNETGPGTRTWVKFPPLYAEWMPHVGPGTVPAIVVALLVIVWGPTLAGRLRFGALLVVGYVTSVAWTFGLALVDGVEDGLEDSLEDRASYLFEVPGISNVATFLREFSGRILWNQPDSWTVHVAGHPPGATLVFVWLDRIGLGGVLPAAFACVLVGCLFAVAVPATLAILGRTEHARATVPLAALFPGAVWVGVSPDGLFAGVTSCGLALLAWAGVALRQRRRGGAPAAFVAGLVLGFGIFLSYGLVLLGVLALVIAGVAAGWREMWKPVLPAAVGALVVVALFALAGFWWLEGYHLVVERYYQGVAAKRSYEYWVWGNLAALALVLGPALVAGARRGVLRSTLGRPWLRGRVWEPVAALAAAVLVAITVADLSGLSKAEVERIWLPFAVWLIPAAALLPAGGRRWWLAAQAATALTVNHLLLTLW